MLQCDLNCDMGEGAENDAIIMPFISAANIACGYHAGDDATMLQTLIMAKNAGVKAGAHPSYPDRENFGRKDLQRTAQEVYQDVVSQILKIKSIASAQGIELHHVKPHGALYNKAAKEISIARAIVQAIKDVDAKLVLYGLSGSCLISEGKAAGLATKSEVFADRTYEEDGSLTPRSIPGARINDTAVVLQQVLQMVHQQTVTTRTGKTIYILAQTICLHSDEKNAGHLAKAIHDALTIQQKEL